MSPNAWGRVDQFGLAESGKGADYGLEQRLCGYAPAWYPRAAFSGACRAKVQLGVVAGQGPVNRVANQEVLVGLLSANLDLAFTFLESARIVAKDFPDPSRALVARARATLESVRQLAWRIQDANIRQQILTRANELESSLPGISGL